MSTWMVSTSSISPQRESLWVPLTNPKCRSQLITGGLLFFSSHQLPRCHGDSQFPAQPTPDLLPPPASSDGPGKSWEGLPGAAAKLTHLPPYLRAGQLPPILPKRKTAQAVGSARWPRPVGEGAGEVGQPVRHLPDSAHPSRPGPWQPGPLPSLPLAPFIARAPLVNSPISASWTSKSDGQSQEGFPEFNIHSNTPGMHFKQGRVDMVKY